jgi:plastocyanin
MRLSLLPLLALAATVPALMLACGDDDDDDDGGNGGASAGASATRPSSGGEDARVTVSDNRFEPSSVTITPNHEVIWEWSGSNPHSIVGTFDGEQVQSPRLTGSGTFVFSFSKAGTFSYQCGVHGASMTGKVEIE